MRAFMAVSIMCMFFGWIMSLYDLDKSERLAIAKRVGAAINFVQYREGAMRYSFFHKDAPDGPVSGQDVLNFLPGDWRLFPGRAWHARIDGGYVYVYGEATPEEIENVNKFLGHSPSVGECQRGRLRPSDIPLPDFIPDGNVVAVFGSNRYRPDNKDYPAGE